MTSTTTTARHRTIAEGSKADGLAKVTHDLFKSGLLPVNNGDTRLNLALLPTETQFTLGMMTPEHTMGQFTMGFERAAGKLLVEGIKAKSVECTLRQVKFVDISQKRGSDCVIPVLGTGMEINVPRDGGQKVAVYLDGMNAYAVSSMINMLHKDFASMGVVKGATLMAMMVEWKKHEALMPFVPSDSLRFPNRLQGREQATFLGLPKGTVLPTKSGGMFKVVDRMNLHCDRGNYVTGHLRLQIIDEPAHKVAEDNGWAKSVAASGDILCLAPANLMTDKDRHKIDLERIKLPFINPLTDRYAHLFREVTMLVDDMGDELMVVAPKARGMVYHTNKDALAATLDDFFFGTG